MAHIKVLEPGHYAFCSHTPFLDGNVLTGFIGRWEESESGRALHKFPLDSEIDGGELMYLLQLKKPISIAEYREVHRDGIHPLVPHPEADIIHLLVVDSMLHTLPNAM